MKHQATCIYRLVACPVCYETNIQLKNYNQHVARCLCRLEQIQKYKNLPTIFQTDIDLELKLEALQQSINNLTNDVLKMDTTLQDEVVAQLKAYHDYRSSKRWAIRGIKFMQRIFNQYLGIYCITSQLLIVLLYELCFQLWHRHIKAVAGIILTFQLVQYALFLLYNVYYMKNQFFRGNTIRFMIVAFLAQWIWFAGLFQSIEIISPDQLDGMD